MNNSIKPENLKKHNFYAGPSILPKYTVKKSIKAIKNFADTGISILSVSHRSKEFVEVMENTQALMKKLLYIPDSYAILFLGGGASTQFCMIPYNFLNNKAAYLNTGSWAAKAQKEAYNFGEVVELASSKDKNYCYIPKNYTIPQDCDYFHITTNNTIFGTQIKEDLEVPVPLMADMSSDILSRPVDVLKYTLIYGGAQKNLAPAGVTYVIIKKDALGKLSRDIPIMLNYQTHINKNSMFNTPPVFAVYGALQTLKWIHKKGGVEAMQRRNTIKAAILYDEIDRNKLFRCTVPNEKDRSVMNICFVMNQEYADLEAKFLDFTQNFGILGIKGHRSVGGFRASTYNALPMKSVKTLVKCMREFEKNT